MRRQLALGAGGLLAVAIGGVYLATSIFAPANNFEACARTSIAGGSVGGPFTLVSETGETVTDADILTEPALVYFGYTFCPDVCPLDAARNGFAAQILDERGEPSITPVFITVDPDRDTVEVVRDFADNFHDRMIGLTGSPEQIKAAAGAYRVYYQARKDEDPDYYLVDHTSLSYLVLPDHGTVAFFRTEEAAEDVADTIACFLDAA